MSKKIKQEAPYPVRISKDKINEAKNMGINVADLFRRALDKALSSDICPTCKQPINKGKLRLRG